MFGFQLADRLVLRKEHLKRKARNFSQRKFGLTTPMEIVLTTLGAKGLLPKKLHALELFGSHGLWLTADYAGRCETLDFWEVRPLYAHFAKNHIKGPDLRIHVGDSIAAVKSGAVTKRAFNLIVIDNPVSSPYGEGYIENFDLFPSLYDCLEDESVVVLNMAVDLMKYKKHLRPPSDARDAMDWLGGEWTELRKAFFAVNSQDVLSLPVDTAIQGYLATVPDSYFTLDDHFFVPRNHAVMLLVMCLKRRPAQMQPS